AAVVVVLEAMRDADFGRRDLDDIAIGDGDETVALAGLAAVAKALLKLRFAQFAAGRALPDDLRAARCKPPRFGFAVVHLEREPRAGVDVDKFADVGLCVWGPADFVSPRLLGADGE